MTAITPTEITVEDIPGTLMYGTPKRRARIFNRGTVDAGGSNTLNLATYIPGLADVEGQVSITEDGVVGTTVTWSTTTITLTDVGVNEVCLVGTFT